MARGSRRPLPRRHDRPHGGSHPACRGSRAASRPCPCGSLHLHLGGKHRHRLRFEHPNRLRQWRSQLCVGRDSGRRLHPRRHPALPRDLHRRVNGYPGPAAEACVSTPPATAYWAIWHGPAGGAWTYSNSGAASLNPAPGTAIGLAFGAGRTPGMAPPALPKPTTSTTRPQPTQSSTTKGGGTTTPSSSTSRAAGSSTTDPTSTAPSATGSASPRHTGSTSTKSTAGTTSSTSESRTPPTASESSATSVAAPAGADGGKGPSPLAIVGGGALAGAALVAGAIVVRRQRDRARMS